VASAEPGKIDQALPLLRRAGTLAELPVLLDLLAAKPDDTERREAVAAILRRASGADEAAALLELRWRDAAPELRKALLGQFAALGRGEAHVRQALSTPALMAAAIAAAGDWPTAALAADLAAATAVIEPPVQRTLALRSLIALLDRAERPPVGTCIDLLDRAVRHAATDEDVRLVLSVLPRLLDERAVVLALRLSHDQDVSKEAALCLLKLAKGLGHPRPPVVNEALTTLAGSEDPEIHQAALRALQETGR